MVKPNSPPPPPPPPVEDWRETLPPLNALRAFEAAARRMSFARAAEELGVTPGAISQQISVLEAFIGAPLFKRLGRQVKLNPVGEAALPYLREGFEKLSEGARLLRAPARRGKIVVSVAPSFAAKWLVPRIDGFQAAHPDAEVWISADMGIVDFSQSQVDVAVRYGPGQWEGVRAELLLKEQVLPVCSPDYEPFVQGRLNTPGDLKGLTLLHDGGQDNDPSCPDWAMWLKARKVDGIDPSRGPRFNQAALVIEAAASGRGVALAKRMLAHADLAAGRLVAPFADGATDVGFAYYVAVGKGRQLSAEAKAFIVWLKAEARAHEVAAEPTGV